MTPTQTPAQTRDPDHHWTDSPDGRYVLPPAVHEPVVAWLKGEKYPPATERYVPCAVCTRSTRTARTAASDPIATCSRECWTRVSEVTGLAECCCGGALMRVTANPRTDPEAVPACCAHCAELRTWRLDSMRGRTGGRPQP